MKKIMSILLTAVLTVLSVGAVYADDAAYAEALENIMKLQKS